MGTNLKRISVAMAMIISALAISGCMNDPEVDAYPTVKFSTEVQPIITANCTQSGCHGSSNAEEFSLLTYNDIINHVTPGNGRKSQLYKVITGRYAEIMPPSPSELLTEDQIRTIFVWIEQGAPNN